MSIDSVQLSPVGAAEAGRYLDLTFPSYRPLLSVPDGRFVAIAATAGGAPAGLALAHIESPETATVLSVAVRRCWRRHGLAGALLARLEEELRALGSRSTRCVYVAGNPSTDAVERLLRRRGWETPAPRTLICRAYATVMKTAPWMQNPPLLDGASLFPWAELSENERGALAPDMPPNFEPANSLGLRWEGEVAGWMVTHRIARSLIRYTRLSLKPELRRTGRAVALVAASVWRHPVQTREVDEIGVWHVSMDNRLMLNFVRRRMVPYLFHVCRSMGSRKSL